MYVIVAYDVGVARVNKVKGYLRTRLTWVQNSLFEGEVPESWIPEIRAKVAEIINTEEDSVIFYIASSGKYVTRETLGIKKGDPEERIL